ncbi:MAG: hypothetical protein K8S98_00760 [Planctomycetes bacterium]|nr:hypothetical protein [Planctomycetota bacterium]
MKLKPAAIVPVLLAVGVFALASFRPQSVLPSDAIGLDDDPPPPECPLCGGDPALHAKRLADLATLRFEILFDEQIALR